MKENTPQSIARLYKTGLWFVSVSFIVYVIADLFAVKNTDDFGYFGFFILNYALSVIYTVLVLSKKQWSNIPLVLVLCLISAWSLNRSLPVFEESVTWLSVVLVVYSVGYIALPAIDKMPVFARHLVCVLLGAALVLFIYLSGYLGELYIFGLVAFLAAGISLHSFVPLLFVVYTIWKVIVLVNGDRRYSWSVLAGVLASVAVAGVFIYQWSNVNTAISKNFRSSLIDDDTDMPEWIKIAQHMPADGLTEKYLKGDIIYTMPSRDGLTFGWGMPSKNFEEGRKHDPLIMLAALCTKMPEISQEDRVKILEAMYVSRHNTQDRLWSGVNLKTSSIITNVRLWPEQRIAYTEKIINVQNSGVKERWWNREEAIYTFHLPEGGVVTSLSLWIDGKEQKGILTSKQKADSAYKTIVGVEQRDPSVVHWQEGNTVSVRVFPVPTGKGRLFKVGITAPLTFANGTLRYDNIWFEGPATSDADETRQIDWVKEPAGLKMPEGFSRNSKHRYIREGKYEDVWSMEVKDPGFQQQNFRFNGYNYAVKQYNPQRAPATIKRVYLDVNEAWSKAELEQVTDIAKGKEVYVFNDYAEPVTTGNLGVEDLKRLMHQHFSIYPFHMIEDPSTALVITKSTRYSPTLSDIKGSDFGDSLAGKMKTTARIKLFNLGGALSPYLRTLKEHRAFDFEQGNMNDLKQLVSTSTFVQSTEDDNNIVVDNAMLTLTRSTDSTAGNGQDHLMRLFAYNHLMSRLKGDLFPDTDADTTLVNEADQAYIVTPVSSLIVLETQADYDRFDIRKSKDALGNATMKSNGAVPEPHEWALIILACVSMAWIWRRERIKKTARV